MSMLLEYTNKPKTISNGKKKQIPTRNVNANNLIVTQVHNPVAKVLIRNQCDTNT